MRKSLVRPWPLSALVAVATLCALFQNCSSGGFDVKSGSLTSSSMNTQPGSSPILGQDGGLNAASAILPLNPFVAFNNNDTTPIAQDFTTRLLNVQLMHLQNAAYLTNGIFNVDVDDAFPSALASPHANLVYLGTDPQFQQVNSYYHIDQFITQMKTLGLFPSNYELSHINAHCQAGSSAKNNAYYDPSTHTECLGYALVSGFTAWSANDADAIVHEFGHSINHTVSTSAILSSTGEAGALDESFADLWAYSSNQNPRFASWYGSAILQAQYPGITVNPAPGIRDLASVHKYPDELQGEVHADSILLTPVFYELEQAGATADQLRQLATRILSDLQSGDNFASAILDLQQEAAALGLNTSALRQSLQSRNLLRKDDPNNLSLDPITPVFVVDNHAFPDYQANGNCNKSLDVGESVLLFPNLVNSGSAMGNVTAKLQTTAPPAEIEILAGGDVASYLRFKAGAGFHISEMNQAASNYSDLLLTGAFGIRATAQAHGTYSFTIQLVGFNSIDNSPLTKTIGFSLTVGNQAVSAGSCSSSAEKAVLP